MPPNDSKGTGSLTATYDTTTKKPTWTVTYANLSGPPFAAHFHGPAGPGKEAPVEVPVTVGPSPIQGSATLTPAQEKDLLDGNVYFNSIRKRTPRAKSAARSRRHSQARIAGESRQEKMPELPEVGTSCAAASPRRSSAQNFPPSNKDARICAFLSRRILLRVSPAAASRAAAAAKYLLADLDDRETLVTSGMSGSFRSLGRRGREHARPVPQLRGKDAAHDHVVFRLSNGKRIVYNDPRRFGFMLLVKSELLATHPLFRNVGIEPLSEGLDGAALAQLFSGKKAPLKAALLDQSLIAGLGNIYVGEALHRAGLSPRRAAGSIASRSRAATERAALLAKSIREILEEAIEAGGSSLRDHRQTNGDLGYFQHNFRVYDRAGAPCPRPGCGGTIKRIVQSGRATFYCATCQK